MKYFISSSANPNYVLVTADDEITAIKVYMDTVQDSRFSFFHEYYVKKGKFHRTSIYQVDASDRTLKLTGLTK